MIYARPYPPGKAETINIGRIIRKLAVPPSPDRNATPNRLADIAGCPRESETARCRWLQPEILPAAFGIVWLMKDTLFGRIIETSVRTFSSFIILAVIFFAACGSGAVNSSVELVNKTADGLAINGYDTVAYHTLKTATRGKPEFEYIWKGAEWLFDSAENRDRFAADPDAFAPEYGGYCAYSVAEGKPKSSDPDTWKIVDGKLYLIQSGEIKVIWESDQDGLLKRSDENWNEVELQHQQN